MNLTNLADERIVITGGDGFLGRHLRTELVLSGVASENILVPLIDDFDLTHEVDVARMYAAMSPTVVIHLAAEVGGIGANKANPGRFFYSNMAMGLHLIEHARQVGLKKFVQVGTVCAYPKFTPVPFKEEDLWKGYPEETNAPYGIAKKALLVMLQAYRQQYGLNGIYLLPVNLYGPGDNFDLKTSHVIPALIRKFATAKKNNEPTVKLWGTGVASREFFYVTDCAKAIRMATENYEGQDPVNLGASSEITINELAQKIRTAIGYEGTIIWDSSQPDGQPRRCLDTTRAKELFGFKAKTPLDKGLKQTINWFNKGSA